MYIVSAMVLGGSYCWSIISPAGALSGVYVWESGEEIEKEEEIVRGRNNQ